MILNNRMSKQVYIDKIKELDEAYDVLKSAISKNRQDRDIWQNMLDNFDMPKNDFPLKSRRDIKITYILKNIFKRGVTMSVIESKYDELNGKHEKLSNVMRRLKSEGVLASIRYNKQNTMTFWGLSEWVDENDFHEEYKPLKSELPFKIIVVEIL